MAAITHTLASLPQSLGGSTSNLERLIRALRVARLLPLGKPGGGKGAAHYGAIHLAYILVGHAGQLPSDAPEAVRALRSLRWMRHPLPEGVLEPLPTLEDMLADWIVRAGRARREGGAWLPESEAVLRSWTMQLCLNPIQAIITVRREDGKKHAIVYTNDPMAPHPGVRRLTVISGDVLLAVGELLADTEKQLATTPSLLDQAHAKASPESKSAGHPRQGTPTLSKGQTRATGSSGVLADALDVTCGLKGPQGNTLQAWAGLSFDSFERRAPCPI